LRLLESNLALLAVGEEAYDKQPKTLRLEKSGWME